MIADLLRYKTENLEQPFVANEPHFFRLLNERSNANESQEIDFDLIDTGGNGLVFGRVRMRWPVPV
jgi:hypothetical protein